MSNTRLLASIQHAITYPSGHLDPFASFGPAFEMTAAEPQTTPTIAPKHAETLSESANFDARRFILGGQATFTLQGLKDRYTYRATTKESTDQTGSVIFLALLTGPDNTADYTYLGIIDARDGSVRLTRKSRMTDQSQPVVAVRWAFRRIWQGTSIAPAKIYHVGRCGRCGRALTVPASIESGFGPECLGKLGE